MLTLNDNALSDKEKWDVVLERARWSVQLGAPLKQKKKQWINQWIKCKVAVMDVGCHALVDHTTFTQKTRFTSVHSGGMALLHTGCL